MLEIIILIIITNTRTKREVEKQRIITKIKCERSHKTEIRE